MSSRPWYPWYVGDARAKMAGLSLASRGAYRELLDHYYSTAQPLPCDPLRLYRIAGAQTDEEKAAVDEVAGMFFTEESGQLHNKRADAEIEKSQSMHDALSKAGRKGGLSKATSQDISQAISQAYSPALARPQPQPHIKELTTLSGKPDRAALKAQAAEILEFLNAQAGRAYKPVPANLDMISARIKEGASVEEIRAVIAAKCKQWLTDPKMVEYLRPATLFSRTNFAQYQGQLTAATPQAVAGSCALCQGTLAGGHTMRREGRVCNACEAQR